MEIVKKSFFQLWPWMQEVLDSFHFSMISSFRFYHQTNLNKLSLQGSSLVCAGGNSLGEPFYGVTPSFQVTAGTDVLLGCLGKHSQDRTPNAGRHFKIMEINDKSSRKAKNVCVNKECWSRGCGLGKQWQTRPKTRKWGFRYIFLPFPLRPAATVWSSVNQGNVKLSQLVSIW